MREFFSKVSPNLKIICGGLLHGLAFAPFNSMACAITSVFILYSVLLKSNTRKEIIRLSLLFGISYYIFSLHWIVNSLLVDAKQWWFLIPFALVLLPSLLSLYYLIISVPFFYIKQRVHSSVILIMIFSSLCTISEVAKSYFFTGFPWNLLGTIWLDYESISQIIFYTNIFFLGFLTIFVSLLGFNILFTANKKTSTTLLSLISLSVFAFIKFDTIKLNNQEKPHQLVKLRLVQPNIAQKLKWKKNDIYRIINTLDKLSFTNDEFIPDVIIWPETSWPFSIDIQNNLYDTDLNSIVRKLKPNQALLTGMINTEGDKIFNSAVVFKNLQNSIFDFYNKKLLVPFGEFVPFSDLIEKFVPTTTIDHFPSMNFGDKNQQDIKISNNLRVLPLICYEAIFTYKIFHDTKFLVNLTNDAWFGNSFGPRQHLRAVRAQVIKTNLPLVRVANTGISAIINNRGKVIAQTELETRDVLDWNLVY